MKTARRLTPIIVSVLFLFASVFFLINLSAKKSYKKSFKKSPKKTFSKTAACPQGDKSILYLDKLSKNSYKSKKSYFKRLSNSKKVCHKGNLYTVGELRKLMKNKKKTSGKKEAVVSKKSKQLFKKRKSKYNKGLKGQRLKETKKYKLIVKKFKMKKVYVLPTGGFTIAQPEPADPDIPVMTNLSVRIGQTGDGVVVTGVKFGNRRGTVKLNVKPNVTVNGRIELWSDQGCAFKIPSYEGIKSNHPGTIIIRTAAGKESAIANFVFKPTMDYVRLCCFNPDIRSGACDNIRAPGGGSSQDEEIDGYMVNCNHNIGHNDGGASHFGGLWFGCNGVDTFFNGVRLKNNWVVDDVKLRSTWITDSEDSHATLRSFNKNKSHMKTTVIWSVGSGETCAYVVDIYIRGPKGVPYK